MSETDTTIEEIVDAIENKRGIFAEDADIGKPPQRCSCGKPLTIATRVSDADPDIIETVRFCTECDVA